MRKSDLKKNHDLFDVAVSRYGSFMEKVIDAKRVIGSAQEKRDIAESVLLRLCAYCEYFVDEHLVACVNCDSSQLSKFFGVTIPKNPDKGLCRALLFGERYRDFRSVGQLKKFTTRILPKDSNPFLAISASHTQLIDEVCKIRNYLSHYSSSARHSLFTMYKEKFGRDRFLEPGQFLLGYQAKQLWRYFDAFKGASSDMKAWY